MRYLGLKNFMVSWSAELFVFPKAYEHFAIQTLLFLLHINHSPHHLSNTETRIWKPFQVTFQAHPIFVIDEYHCLDWKHCLWSWSNAVICIHLHRKKNCTYKTVEWNTIAFFFFFFRIQILLILGPLFYFFISFGSTLCRASVFVIRVLKLKAQVFRNFSLLLSKMTLNQKINKQKERQHVYAS